MVLGVESLEVNVPYPVNCVCDGENCSYKVLVLGVIDILSYVSLQLN